MPRQLPHLLATLAFALAAAAGVAQEPGRPASAIRWRTSLGDAAAALRAPENQSPCAIYLFSADSRREQEMEEKVWSAPALREVADKAIWAKADVSESDNRSFAKGRNVLRVPCVLLLDAKGEELGRLQADEIDAQSVAQLVRLHAPAAPPAAQVFSGAPSQAFGAPAATTAAVPPGVAGQAQARPVIVGWTLVDRVEANGVGLGMYRGKPIAISGVAHTLAGQWVYFHDLRDEGTRYVARFAPPPVIMTEPPTGGDGRSVYEAGQWYDCVVAEPAQRRPGNGVARLRGMVTFVPGAQPGDRVIIEIETVNDRWLASRLVYKFPPQSAAPARR